MNRKNMIALAAATAFIGAGNSPAATDIGGARRFAAIPAPKPGQLSILTYNVNGLPWPITTDGPAKLARIADRLAELRTSGRAPQVVLLQEAFTPEAEAIAPRAGYRYTVFGPAAADRQPAAPGYTGPRSLLKGEGLKPLFSSGLIMMSDFKISDVRRTPFPVGACSGYDCLANKGILSARIAVPGVAAPVEIVTTHMNSGNPSGQPEPVNRVAFLRQLDALGDFTDNEKRKPLVRIYAGDFNMGHSTSRLTALMGYIRHRKGLAAAAQGRDKRAGMCRANPDECHRGFALSSNVPPVHANDWQFVTAPQDVQLTPVAREIMFGRDRAGKTLSDHFGLKVIYQFR
jgi:endonuclease/exonuclease/phosphatase family metal-dependent hydrolase